jgi:C-terminal processing protease CtpA/Prc
MSRWSISLALAIPFLCLGVSPCLPAPSVDDTLSFEAPAPAGTIPGFSGYPPGTVFLDSTQAHAGRCAVRLERMSASSSEFSALRRGIPARVSGRRLALRGWVRTQDVTGSAGLWLREDGGGGLVQFDNLEGRRPSGTTPWTQYTIELPLDTRARSIVFGALLIGAGAAYVDDLQLLVDGRPIAEAPASVRETTAVDTDHEFDAGSRVAVERLSTAQVESLVLLGKVWGFVKYHHPRVTSARLHWDYELFRVLPVLLAAKDRVQATSVLAAWLERVGEPAPCKPCATLPDSVVLRPRTAWIRDRARLGERLSGCLQRIDERRAAGGAQYYLGREEGVGNPSFANEAPFASQMPPDAGYRLLALYRFWNIIEYWFPYRDLIREDWDGVLRESVPRLASARDADDYRRAMIALLARARDGHANVWSDVAARPPQGICQLPVALRVVEGRFVVATWADSVLGPASGFEIGDAIVSLDGAPADSLAAAWSPWYGASNDIAKRRDIAVALTKGPRGPCRVSILRGGRVVELRATRDSLGSRSAALAPHDLPGATFRLLDPEVAYLKLSSVVAADVPSYLEKAAGTRCLVVDIRNYPSQFVPFALGRHLVERPTQFARFTNCDPANPGAFTWRESVRLDPVSPRYDGRVVILVDESSQSQAEYTAMALRAAPGALVVGSTTAGADGNVSAIPLPGGLRGMISGIGVFYPDGRPTQQIGIVPDLVVRPTIAGIRAGRDEVLEAGIEKALGRRLVVRRD